MNSKSQAIEFALAELRADNNHTLIYDSDDFGNYVRCVFDGITSSKFYYKE